MSGAGPGLRTVVLVNEGSRSGFEVLNEMKRRGVRVDGLVLLRQPFSYQRKLFGFVRQRVGLMQTLWFGMVRVIHDFMGKREQRRRPGFEMDVARLAERVVRTRGTNTPETLQALRDLAPDVIVIGQTGILREKLLAIPRLGILNGHTGVLPHYRGQECFMWALLNGEPQHVGVTIHWVNTGVDAGPILRVEHFASRNEPLHEYEAWLFRQAARMLADTVASIDPEKPPAGVPQRPEDGRQYYKMPLQKERAVRAKLRELKINTSDDSKSPSA